MTKNELPHVDSASSAVVQSIAGCMSEAIGQHGLTAAEFAPYLARADVERLKLCEDYASGALPLLRLPEDTADIDAAALALAKLSAGARTIVFFGTGGSGLGGQTLAQFAGWNIPGGASADQRNRPRTRFYDNLDGATLTGALAELDLGSTRFVVTSKSGGTAETLAQAIAALQAVKAAGLGEQVPQLFLGITEPAQPDQPGIANGLRGLFAAHHIPLLDHHTRIGGRFSCLTNVGLMPAIARGVDVAAVRAGAREVVDAMLTADDASDCPPAVGAALSVAMAKERGIRTLVMMPYNDKLGKMAAWFVQLWGESLGKGGEGTTPIGALGPLDQHSQLQLFMDGPREHLLTVLRVGSGGVGPVLDAELAKLAGADYLAGQSVGDIVHAQAHAVPEALAQAGRPVRTFDIPNLDAHAMGMLLMHFMIETILAGRMLGLDPFDQPAVELAKVLTRERLGA